MAKKDKKTFLKKGGAVANTYSEQERFIDKLGASGVKQETLILISNRLRYERALAELEAAKAYCEAQGFMPLSGNKVGVDDMVSLIVRRCQGLQVAIEGVSSELGITSTSYLGLSQLAWDVTNLAERVEAKPTTGKSVGKPRQVATHRFNVAREGLALEWAGAVPTPGRGA